MRDSTFPRAAAVIAAFCLMPSLADAAASFVPGQVPDWDQPYQYFPLPDGPGPDPNPGLPDPFNAWCAPASAANLLGHWEDVHGVPVADHAPFPVPGQPWPGPPLWHDWSLGDPRPPRAPAPVGIDGDLGWFMDTNLGGSTARGNAAAHVGTYVKDIHAGLADLIVQAATLTSGIGSWTTGTRGASFALGTDVGGAPATPHPTAASAFAEIQSEIDAGHTILVAWAHWNIAPGPLLPPIPAATDESQFGGGFFSFVSGPPGPDPWGNDENWSEGGGGGQLSLGHVTTAVGYIAAGDPDDPNRLTQPTDWVVVHDNVSGTPRNVIVPLSASEYAAGLWVANVNAARVVAVPSSSIPAIVLLLFLSTGCVLAVLGRLDHARG